MPRRQQWLLGIVIPAGRPVPARLASRQQIGRLQCDNPKRGGWLPIDGRGSPVERHAVTSCTCGGGVQRHNAWSRHSMFFPGLIGDRYFDL